MNEDVFVVDDDESVSQAIGRLLRTAGYRVRTFASAVEAALALGRMQPACLIVDVRMPGHDGLELFDVLREGGSTIPVIFITGHGDIAMAVRAMKNGAADFLAKPFDDEALLDSVKQAIAKVRALPDAS